MQRAGHLMSDQVIIILKVILNCWTWVTLAGSKIQIPKVKDNFIYMLYGYFVFFFFFFFFAAHWQDQPIRTVALMELVRKAIDDSDTIICCRQGFPAVLTSLGLKQPKHLVGLISKVSKVKRQKVKRHVKKAELLSSKEWDDELLSIM